MLLHGVDFSGADDGGGHKIRVVTRELPDPGTQRPAGTSPPELRNQGRFDRRSLLRLIERSAEDGQRHLWRVDAPFGLPVETLDAHGLAGWADAVRWMSAAGSPRAWRGLMRDTSRREPRRHCDDAFRAPMAPMNLRVFKQTWTCMVELLEPLGRAGISIEPMAPRAGAPVVICEGCPASALAARALPVRGYKGAGDPPRARREEILSALARLGVRMPPPMRAEAAADQEGDLLDAIVLTTDPFQAVPPADALREAWIY